ncbi:hypothetical protein [Eubacterium sp.]|uniref:hypothetical protein n=1 Tax=Eubacterium sp. TaxID=142586 RepID=UPI0025F7539A|nr:hypothetical protein [Eubacterium sp.]MCR5629873.1 hypothetical protein [Eubacterium sp.]
MMDGVWLSDIPDDDPFEDLIQKFVDYFEKQGGKLMTPSQLFETRKTLERLSEGSLRLAEAIVEQSIEKKWAKLYRLQDKQKEFEIKNSSINRQVADDEIERQLREASQKEIDKAVNDIRVEIFGSIDEYNKLSIEERQERRRRWRIAL